MRIALKTGLCSALSIVSLAFFAPEVCAQTAEQKQDFVQELNSYTIGEITRPLTMKKLIDFQMSPAWWTAMTDKDQAGVKSMCYATRDLIDFGKRMGWGDLYQWENSGNGTKEEWKPRIEAMLDEWRPKVSLTIKADSPTCDKMNFDLFLRYLGTVTSALTDDSWKPASGQCHIVFVPSKTAKDIACAISPDGKIYTITAPIEVEPNEWDSKIKKGFQRGNANKL